MPVRLIRDGILTSEAMNGLSWAEEVFYRRLMSVVDDHGRFHALPKLIRAACYPLLIDKVSDSDIGKWLSACETAALVRVYPALDGKRYVEILKFGQRVQSKSKFPDPADVQQESTVDHGGSPISNRLVVVEDEDVKHTSAVASLPTRFQEFWETWPSTERKTAKAKCQEKWKAKKLDTVADQIIAHVEALKTSKTWQDGFEPAPLTYLNQTRWEDGIPADRGASQPWEGAI